MRRFSPLILVLIAIMMLIAGIVGVVLEAEECARSGGMLVAAGTRGELCVGGW